MSSITQKQKVYLKKLIEAHPATAARHGLPTIKEIPTDSTAAQAKINSILGDPMVGHGKPYRAASLRASIAETLRYNQGDTFKTIEELQNDLGKRIVFSRNANGTRVPLSISEQRLRLSPEVYSVHEALHKMYGEKNWPKPGDTPVEEADSKEPPKPKEPMTAKEFYKFIEKLRKFLAGRKADGNHMDTLGMRVPIFAKRMNEISGIPFEAALYSATMHWPEDVRSSQGIEKYDVTSFGEAEEGDHKAMPYLLALAKARILICLVGEPGVGKSHAAEQLANRLDLPFGMTPMTAGATPSWLLGSITMDPHEPYKTRPMVHFYEHGGVILLDEMDAADPNMLLVANNMLANETFTNPVTGRTIKRHEDFIAVAGMNTHGLGANRHMTGRERLDAATIDRWRMGRAELHLDTVLEKHLFFG